MVFGSLIDHGLITLGIHVLERARRVRFVKCRFIQPNVDIRISFSCLLRISEGGRYLLVRNLHRPELFGPFGGVFKHYDRAKEELDRFEFKDFCHGGTLANFISGI